MTSVIDAASDSEDAIDRVYGGGRIEIDEREMRAVSRHVDLLGRLKTRLNDFARRVTYGQ